MNNYISKLFGLEGKTAVVTGAGGHLCGEMARSFARAGCKVAVLDLRLEKAKVIEDEIRAEGFTHVISMAIDVAKKEDFQLALKNILDTFYILKINNLKRKIKKISNFIKNVYTICLRKF